MSSIKTAAMAALFAPALVIAFWQAPATARQSDAALRATLRRDLDGYLASHAKAEHISALSLSVSLSSRDANINVTSGTTRIGGGGRVQPSALWNIGSNTKAFTACLILQLESEGKLTIDQTVTHWLPQYPAWAHVTIRRLLNMTSGIPGYDNVPAMGYAEAKSLHRRWSDAQLVAFADPVYGKSPPPTHGYNYSNTNYILAGMIVERVTGHTYADELRSRLIDGLRLRDTFYSPNVYPRAIVDRMVSGYFYNDGPGDEPFAGLLGKDMRENDMSWAAAAGGMIATPQDLTRWARALYSGKVLPARQQRELMSLVSIKTGKPLASTSAADPQGFGLGVVQVTRGTIGTFWFYQGETLGYRMIHVWLPKSDVVFALALNSQPPSSQEAHIGALIEQIYADLVTAKAIRPNN